MKDCPDYEGIYERGGPCWTCRGDPERCPVGQAYLVPGREPGPAGPPPPHFPPQAHAAQMADEIAAFADRYPLMWAPTLDALRGAAESLRWQVRHGYLGGAPTGPTPGTLP